MVEVNQKSGLAPEPSHKKQQGGWVNSVHLKSVLIAGYGGPFLVVIDV